MENPPPNADTEQGVSGTRCRGPSILYRIFIEPKSLDEDRRQCEFIFNVIISTALFIILFFGVSAFYTQRVSAEYTDIRSGPLFLSASFFGLLLLLSRIGLTKLASYLFIGLYFLGATYAIHRWSIELPFGTLSYAVIIIFSGIVVNSRFAMVATVVISATFITLGWLQASGHLATDTSWRTFPLEFKNTIQHTFAYTSIMIVSWLANREITHSLARARKSEKDLKEERDRLEMKIEERTRELKASQHEKVSQLYRFAEFGKLASGIYHDLINPLTAVSLSVEKLQEDAGMQSSETRKHVDKAIRASRRMDTFLNTVRKQLAAEEIEGPFSPANEIRDAIDMLSHKARSSRATVSADVDKDAVIHGSATKFFQVVVNLLSNAIDSYRDSPSSDCRVDVTLRRGPDSLVLVVRDEGCGIPPTLRSAVFEPFFTTKANHSGIGLGLSTTKKIVEKNFGGTISVMNGEKAGATFTVIFPTTRTK
ncbi:MAG: HAMP domain-containing sensor histidine kinase [bacterium]|nr:HAMP domain-containing sensor histidine kinase [bacterium]